FLPVRGNPPAESTLVYRPRIIGCGEIYFNDAKLGVSCTEPITFLAALEPDSVTLEWRGAARIDLTPNDLERDPEAPAQFEPVPAAAAKARSYTSWSKAYVDALYRGETLALQKSPSLSALSQPDEPELAFRLRLQQAAREARDAELDRL